MLRWVLVLLLAASSAQAASLTLTGPAVVHVGDHVDYTVTVSLAQGETIRGSAIELILQNGRALTSMDFGAVNGTNARGFLDADMKVDSARLWSATQWVQEPVHLLGLLNSPRSCTPGGPPGSCPDPSKPNSVLQPYTADQGPFTLLSFSFTATAPGTLTLTPVTPADFDSRYMVGYTNGVSGPGSVFYPLLPGPTGSYASIAIVPEPAGAALAPSLLLALLLARRTRREAH
jgi:hypothetical protein